MPQMAPMNWILLNIMFMIIFMLINFLNYFIFMIKPPSILIKSFLPKSIIWKW